MHFVKVMWLFVAFKRFFCPSADSPIFLKQTLHATDELPTVSAAGFKPLMVF